MFRTRRKSTTRTPSLRTRRADQRVRLATETLEARTLLSFNAPINLPTDVSPTGIATADLTENAIADVVVANQGFSGDGTFRGVSVLLGNGDGTFQPASTFDVGPGPFAVVIGDFNGDGIPDLAVTHADSEPSDLNTVSILLGNGDGTFRAAGDLQVGNDPRSVAVGDFNGDGKLDIVTANASSSTVSVLMGNGDGTFQSAVSLPVGSIPSSVAVGDFRGDGNLGIVTANQAIGADGNVSLLLGNGDGTFQSAVTLGLGDATNPQPRSVAVADLTGSGIADIVTATDTDTGGAISVLLGNGDGTFATTVNYTVQPVGGQVAISNPLSVAVGNFDGQQDVIVGNGALLQNGGGGVGQLFLFSGNGDGTFQAPVALNVGSLPVALTVGQFAGDGNLDVAVANAGGGDVTILRGHGDGTFNNGSDLPAGRGASSIAQGDLNGDGIRDLVTANTSDGTISVLFGNGDGTFQAPVTFAVGRLPDFVTVADLTGNGVEDLIVATAGSGTHGTLVVFLGNGDGTFQAPMTFDSGLPAFFPRSIAVGELDGDGTPDLAISYDGAAGAAGILVLAGNGDGTFRVLQNFTFGRNFNLEGAGQLAVADLNGDGSDDLVLPVDSVNGGGVDVLLGDGHGGFHDTGFTRTSVDGASAVAVGEFGNGFADLAVANPLNNTVTVFLGNGSGLFLQAPANYTVGNFARSIVVADLDGNGILDIVTANQTGDTVSILRGNGDGTFQSEVRYLTGPGTDAVVAADFNSDGALDLATANGVLGTVSVLLNNNYGAAPQGAAAVTSSHRQARQLQAAAVDAVFTGIRSESANPLAGGQQTATAPGNVSAVGTQPAETASPQAPLAPATPGTLPPRHQPDGPEATGAAGLIDPLRQGL